MKFDHKVKHNGIWYEVGAEVPASNTVSAKNEKVESDKSTYKRSDIQKMKVEELKALATTLEIAYDDETSGNQLKKDILVKLGI